MIIALGAIVIDRLHTLEVFLAVAEERSFSAGARRLGLSAPAATRAVAALESRLGVRLLTRTTRHVRLTESGRRYAEDARRILAEVGEADEAAAGINATPTGLLTITAPVLFGRIFVAPILVEYLQQHTGTRINALFLDRVVNLVEEGVDVGIRIAELGDSSLQAIQVGRIRRVLCAAPAYLEAHGVPAAPRDLEQHTLIAASASGTGTDGRFGPGAESVRRPPRLAVTSNDGAIEAACRGLGIARVLSYQVAREVQAGQLRIVLEAFEPPCVPVHVVHREGRRGSARVRAFVDLAVQRLRGDPALG